MPTPAYDQDAFRGRDDDVALNSGTFNGGGGLNTNWTQDTGTNFRLRFVVQETAGNMAANETFTLFFDHEGAGYAEMTTSTPLQPADTTQYANGDTTTQVIGSGTYVTGDAAAGVDNAEDTGNVDFGGSDEVEIEFNLTIDAAQVNDADEILVRVRLSDGTVLDAYTNTPTITVNKVATTLTQTAFRFRPDDTAALSANTASDWEDTENTNVSMAVLDQAFRLRIEVEASFGVTEGFKLYYSLNGGSYQAANNETDPFEESTGGNKFEVSCIPSGQYTDLDPTTDLLTTATGTFVAGDGNEDNTTGTVTFSATNHTEHEFCIIVRKLARNGADSANGHISDGDTVDFRLYKDDDTALDIYTNTARLTISNRAGHIGGTWVETPHASWIVDKSGNLYYLSEYADLPTTASAPVMMKSTDGGDSWEAMDEAGAPAQTDLEAGDLRYDPDNDIIHIAIQGPSGDDVFYWTFTPADHATTPDEWVTEQTVDTAATPGDQMVAIEYRADSTVVMFYGDNDGTNDRVRYRIRSSGGTWGSENDLDSEASTNIGGVKTVLNPTDDTIHIFYHAWNGTVGEIWYNTLSSGDSLGTRAQVDQTPTINADGGSRVNNVLRPRIYDAAGTTMLVVGYHEDGGTDDVYINETDISSIDWTANEETALSSVDTNMLGGASVAADLAVDDDNDDIWVWGVDGSDFDPKYDKRVGGAWDGDTDYAQTTDKGIRAEVFTHSSGNGGATVIGVIRHDKNGHAVNIGPGGTGFARYDEIVIAAGGTVIQDIIGAGIIPFPR